MFSIKEYANFFSNKEFTWGFKAGLFISTVAIVFLIDAFLGISYNFHVSHKLENLQEINDLKNKYIEDSTALAELYRMERKELSREHHLRKMSRIIRNTSNINFNTNHVNGKDSTATANTNINKSESESRNIYWMIFSSSTFLIILFIITLTTPIFGDRDSRSAKALINTSTTLVFITLLITICTWVAYILPVFFDRPWLNYTFNILAQVLLISVAGTINQLDKPT